MLGVRLPRKESLARTFWAVLATLCGWLVYQASAWIVAHDGINYRLGDYGLHFVSFAAESFSAIGLGVMLVVGLVAAIPVIIGTIRGVFALRQLFALHLLDWALVIVGLGEVHFGLWLLPVAFLLWVFLLVCSLVWPGVKQNKT